MIYVFPTGGGAGDIAPGVKLSNLTLWQETTLAIQQFSIGKGERHSKDLRLLSTQLNSSQVYVPSIYLSISKITFTQLWVTFLQIVFKVNFKPSIPDGLVNIAICRCSSGFSYPYHNCSLSIFAVKLPIVDLAFAFLPFPLILFSFAPSRVLRGPNLQRRIAFPGAKRLFLLRGRNLKTVKFVWLEICVSRRQFLW